MDTYIGLKLISAEPCKAQKAAGEYAIGSDGYKVMYPDGYTSWSPKEVFEEAYTKSGNWSFSNALFALKQGSKVSRAGWNGKGMWLELQTPTELSKMTLPYIYMFTAQGDTVPWLCSQTDMLADDWGLVE